MAIDSPILPSVFPFSSQFIVWHSLDLNPEEKPKAMEDVNIRLIKIIFFIKDLVVYYNDTKIRLWIPFYLILKKSKL